MTAPPVSVVVVSRHRPDALLRCIAGLLQLDYPEFEIVVVADPDGLATLGNSEPVRTSVPPGGAPGSPRPPPRAGATPPPGGRRLPGDIGSGVAATLKTIAFDEPNISMARNLGIAKAAGEIVAFIDDDAVPEPTWLRHLAAPFSDETVSAAGGYVIGRNGITFQNTARRVDATGAHRPLTLPDTAPQVFDSAPGDAVKTEGTNCAFRADTLLALGGFDPAFAFYADETDLNLRLAAAGARTAIVPLAQVHHGFAASDRRHASRLPRTLFDVGASQAVLLRKHSGADIETELAGFRAAQRRRLLRYMVDGRCAPGDVGRLLRTLDDGMAAGLARPIAPLPPIPAATAPFRPVAPRFEGMRILAGRSWQARRLRRAARDLAARGRRVSLFLFSPSALYHRVRFRDSGYWEQCGGLFGRSDRSQPLFRATAFGKRLKSELSRVKDVRLRQ